MCLLAMSYRTQPGYDLVLIANRDEYFRRPTEPAHFWDDAPGVLAGRDLEQGGTWLGITRTGRLAFLTNYRDPSRHRPYALSRGFLVSDFLAGDMPADVYLEEVAARADRYNDFNLLAGTTEALFYFSSIENRVRQLTPGLYAMSNHLLETPWPKVLRARTRLEEILRDAGERLPEDLLFSLLAESEIATDGELPETGIGRERERLLSPIFITMPEYGTRSSTIVTIRSNGEAVFSERTYPPDRQGSSTARFHFVIESARSA